jgi:hypothetical protein
LPDRVLSALPCDTAELKIQPVFEKLGVRGVGWHSFRHTVGMLLAEMGEHQVTIRDYLRHSNLSVTNKYVRAGTQAKTRVQARLVDAVGRGILALSPKPASGVERWLKIKPQLSPN